MDEPTVPALPPPAAPPDKRRRKPSHVRLQNSLRKKFLKTIHDNWPTIEKQMIKLLTVGTSKDDDPQVRMFGLIIRSIAPEQKEIADKGPPPAVSPIFLQINGVRRGTEEARQEFLQVNAKRYQVDGPTEDND